MFQPFIVPGSEVYYDFLFDRRDSPCFGFKFVATRLSGLWLEVRVPVSFVPENICFPLLVSVVGCVFFPVVIAFAAFH